MRLHKEYGVNPSITTCFYCGKDDAIVLFGDSYKGEAPMKIGCINLEPCPECKSWMKQGIILISVRDDETNLENPYRTGGWCVVKDEVISKIIGTQEIVDQILKKRVAFIPDTVWDSLGLPRGKNE